MFVTHRVTFGTRKTVSVDWFSGVLELDSVDRCEPSVPLFFNKEVLLLCYLESEHSPPVEFLTGILIGNRVFLSN